MAVGVCKKILMCLLGALQLILKLSLFIYASGRILIQILSVIRLMINQLVE